MSPDLLEHPDPPPAAGPLGRLRPRRYVYLARKYWRMNPWKPWWVLHVWDAIRYDLRREGRP